jgi:type VI secretion system secreted protein VgrG
MTTQKPLVGGPQTATVVGPGGEEIFTDKYGRVKVQFHWDREGQRDDKSSCWVRVSQIWAGKNWGWMSIPRIGQEVVVDFLEGDPDQPIITGRVYNADNMPPFDLPANKTQSGLRTRSTLNGTAANCNELRFEDKKGSEQLFIHAEKNQDIEVENDETHWVGHDRNHRVDNDENSTIGRDRSETVQRNKLIQIVGNHSESVNGAMSIVVGRTLTETVALNYSETVGGAMEVTVGAALAITVGAGMSEAVGANKSESIGGSKGESVGGDRTLQVGKNLVETVKGEQSVTIDKDLKENIAGQHIVDVKKEATVKAKKVQITADDEISFKTGSAEIIMKKNGDITIKGGKITVKGSGDVVVKGSKIAEN